MKSLEQYSNEVKNSLQNPGSLAVLGSEISADYSYYAEQLAQIKKEKPTKWIRIKTTNKGELRDKYLSDALTDQFWLATESGQKEIDLKYKLKGLEKMASAIKSHLIVLNNEGHNQF